jgi:ribosomal protein S18 acetylase RimI-like enzyme
MDKTGAEIGSNLCYFYNEIARTGKLHRLESGQWTLVANELGSWPRLVYGVGAEMFDQQTFKTLEIDFSPELLITGDENILEIDPQLRISGYYPFAFWKGMAISNLLEITAPQLPEWIEIVHPKTSEEIVQWLEIVNSELVAPDIFQRSLFERLIDQSNFEAFLLKKDGVGVSTLLVFTTENSTGLYLIATNKSSQKQGFANLLIRQILSQISLKSEKPVILLATQKGQGLYTKLGFQTVNQFFLYRNLNAKS